MSFFLAMGESGRGFSRKLWENQNLKKNSKHQKTKIIDYDGS